MKQIKIFNGVIGLSIVNFPDIHEVENQVNEFIKEDGKSIKVIDVKYQANNPYFSVLVYFEDLGKKRKQSV